MIGNSEKNFVVKPMLRISVIFSFLFSFSITVFSQNTAEFNISEKIGNNPPDVCKTLSQSRLLKRQDSGEFLKKAEQVLSILEELGTYREDFLRTGNLIYLFPALYFHTTQAEFKNVLTNESQHPVEMLGMIIAFYDAYKMNLELFKKGGIKSVEPHWKKYYKNALKGNKENSKSTGLIIEVLLDGIDAHVVYDLPRSIRFILSGSSASRSEIKNEFDKMDAVFAGASEEINRDIIKGLKASKLLLLLDKTFNLGSNYVIYGRKKAWESAVSEKSLPTRKPQPEYNHISDPRKFFQSC